MNKRDARTRLTAAGTLATALTVSASAKPIIDALQDAPFGLHPGAGLQLTTGACADCATIPQALWYFQNELIAAPQKGVVTAGHTLGMAAQADVADFMSRQPPLDAQAPLIWLGSSKVIPRTQLNADGTRLLFDEAPSLAFAVTPKSPANLSYYNAASLAYLAGRPLRLRGELTTAADGETQFTARTLWPLEFAIDAKQTAQTLRADESLRGLVKAEDGGARAPFASRLLWERTAGESRTGRTRDWDNKAVLGIMLNGAQGDDDEAHGGHFAIVTGRYRNDGDWSRWLVYNFYNLGTYSEKNIIAAPTPMDNYLFDLNSGQNWYRPSYMLVAVLKNERTALQYQAAIERVYNHFYRHEFEYHHASANCAGISMDTLRTLGWQLPQRGRASQLKAIAAYAYVAATSLSLSDGRKIYDYLREESTRLYPAVSFEALGEDLLDLVQGRIQRPLTAYEQALAEDVEAIYYVHIPQLPSSRAFGRAPVYSFDEYLQQAPADRSQWQVIPVPPRPFPEELRGRTAEAAAEPALVPTPVAAAGAGLLGLIAGVYRYIRRRGKRS